MNITTKGLQIALYIYQQGFIDLERLSKLTYVCFGFYGAKYQKYLFDDVIEAKENGPIIPSVEFIVYKSDFFLEKKRIILSKEEQEIITKVLYIYGQKIPFMLDEETTSKHTPWGTLAQNQLLNIEINKQKIIDYYTMRLNKIDYIVKSMNTEAFKKVMFNLAKM